MEVLPSTMATGVEENWPVPMRAIGAQNLLTMPGGVTQSGYLHKKGGSQWKIMKWPLRFVIIHKGCIYYFKSSTAANPQGAFSLNGYNRVMRSTEETTSSNVFPFKIIHINKKHRTWYFSAACEEERKKWMMGLRKEINRYEKTDLQGNLSDYSDTEKFYGSIECPVQVKYTSRESESGDYADDDDDDEDEDDYLRPDGLQKSPESEDVRPMLNSSPIQPEKSSKKPLPPLPPPNQRHMSHGLVVIKEYLPSSLQGHLPPTSPAKTENSALLRYPSPNASPSCPTPHPVHLKSIFCKKEQQRRLSEASDSDMKVRSKFPIELNMHLTQMTGKTPDVASPSVPIHKGSSAGPPPVLMNKGPTAGPPPVSVNKGSSVGPPPVPMNKGPTAGCPPVPMHKRSITGPPSVPMKKGSSAGLSPVPVNKGSSAGPPAVPMNKGSSAGPPAVSMNKGSGAEPPPVPLSKGSSTESPRIIMPRGSSVGQPPLPMNKPMLSSIPSETVQVKPKLYKPELLPKGASALTKPPPLVKPKVQKHSTLLTAPLHRSSPEGQSFRSVETEKAVLRPRSQSQLAQDLESEDDDDDYHNVQLPPSVFVNTTESNDVERLFISTSPGSNPENGLYCIRNSSKSGKVLVVWDDSEKKVRNYRIFEKESKCFLESEIKFTCLPSMVAFYYKHTLPIHDSLHLKVPYGYKNPL
ncbi:SH3 domain-binding protein 2-like isoform X2 [Carcharodon carcharias]|uniref:SH3 domain-binding protein 2-like isoform X2 n=1 Tax=Carcharodon carcharias TaxID=13397 RepID=UPI001B7EA81D|nr:SH3 domain-binding protein 2-like isoform X2 [Carcharodon carcharias]